MKPAAHWIFTYFVFALSKGSSSVNPDSYFGCFLNFSNRTTVISQSMTIELCIETCRNNRTTFAGLQGGDQCLCGEDFSELVAEDHCTDACSGSNVQFCGGKVGTAVYSVCSVGSYGIGCDRVCHCDRHASCHRLTGLCPTGCDESWLGQTCDTANASPAKSKWYVGCYADGEPRAMAQVDPEYNTEVWKQNSINKCFELCKNFKNTYIGVQYSYACFCGEHYSKYGTSDKCTSRCRGDASQICGGAMANSVYSLCPSGRFSSDCLARCNCANDTRCVYLNGTCPGGCKPGWTGDTCSVRSCSEANGDCNLPNEVCETVNLKYTTMARCGCRKGYTRHRPWDNCTDVDECLNTVSACGEYAYNCTNTDGSFQCTYCSDGIPENGTCVPPVIAICKANGRILEIIFLALGCVVVLVIIVVVTIFCYRKVSKRSRIDVSGTKGRVEDIEEEDIIGKKNDIYENNYENECSYANVDQPATRIEVGQLASLIKCFNERPGALEKEFNSVPEYSGAPVNVGRRKELKAKNRFKNILPYDHNRVILSNVEGKANSHYINASYITGSSPSEKLIASQGPTQESVDDFWRMILEKRATVIVMITNLQENGKNKCEKYWPAVGEVLTFGNVAVSTVSEHRWRDSEQRSMLVEGINNNTPQQNSATLEITQWQYTAWPDHGVPQDIRSFLTFRRKIRNSMSPDSFTVVHCSAGAGRTGSYIAIDNLLEEAKTGYVDVLGCLKDLRQQRTRMIQTLEQYRFVYGALLERLITGDTVIRRDNYERQLNELRIKDKLTEKSKLHTQFEMLNQTKAGMNKGSGDNCNVVEIQGILPNVRFIVKTISPSDTSDNLWKLCVDHQSNLVLYINETQDVLPFIPTKDRPVAMANYNLILESTSEESCVTICQTTLTRQSESVYYNQADDVETQKITLLIVNAPLSANGECVDYECISQSYSITKRFSQTPKGPIIVMSKSNECLSGFFVAAFNAFDMITEDNEVDVYEIVYDMRMSNLHFIPTMNSYEKLHDIIIKRFVMQESQRLD